MHIFHKFKSIIVHKLRLNTHQFSAPFAAQWQYIMTLIPLPEWRSIDSDNSVLYQSLGSYQLVVRRIVNNINDTSFPGTALRAPGKVSCIQSKCSVFFITSTCTDLIYTHKIDIFITNFNILNICIYNIYTSDRCEIMNNHGLQSR